MKRYFLLNDENRLQYISSTRGQESEIEIEIDENHEVAQNPFIFKYENGELIKDTVYQQELIDAAKEWENRPTKTEELEKAQSDLVFTLMMNGVI
jgi:hypothetical protein